MSESTTATEGVVSTQQDDPYRDCRMYEHVYPEIDELVMVRVNRVTEIGAYVSLLEFNNHEGIILLSNLSRKRIRSVNKHVRVGKIEVLQVLRVDAEKGYIDLSKKLLQAGDVTMCHERYKKSRTVHSIMIRLAVLTETPLKELYEMFGWPLYKKYGHAYDGFKKIIADETVLDEFKLPEKIHKATLDMINKRLAVRSVRVQSDIEVTCFTPEGVLAIKPALRAGLEVCEDEGVQIQLVNTPLYMVSVTTVDKEQGVEILTQVIETIKKEIESRGGNCVVKVEGRVVQA
eukprot:CAMPEP_0177649264 /NCGR_PEP_ID=MMETSP0447-20121125/11287_1 /TAXON_ID=0 /ORGANISM="Stygamoeba regulata, Strain BSH-02190019" /LENGTH=288 /DNA_ID=CAMNT_0019151997 /DNA_START=188 /DNA_END=1054 /DNA_ORIENTATION=+